MLKNADILSPRECMKSSQAHENPDLEWVLEV